MSLPQRWSEAEEQFLRDHNDRTDQHLSNVLRRSLQSVRSKRQALGLPNLHSLKAAHEPTTEEIAKLCLAIQETWTPQTRESRLCPAYRPQPVTALADQAPLSYVSVPRKPVPFHDQELTE